MDDFDIVTVMDDQPGDAEKRAEYREMALDLSKNWIAGDWEEFNLDETYEHFIAFDVMDAETAAGVCGFLQGMADNHTGRRFTA